MNFLRKNTIKKIISYILIGNLIIYNFSSLVLGATGTIIYAPSTATSGSVTATIGSFDESGVVVTNNPGGVPDPYTYTFAINGIFDFEISGDVSTGTVRAEVTWIDTTAPSITLTGDKVGYTNTGLTMTVNFSEEVTGFMETGIVITNGALTNFTSISGSQFTFNLTPTATGLVTVDIAANQCTDLVGRGNTVATQFSIIYDNEAPTAYVEYSTTGNTNQDVIATITGFNETITNLNTGNYAFTNTGSFTFTFEDLAGNTGETTAIVTRIDKIAPTASVEFSTTGQTNQDVTVTITGFTESITGLNATGFTFTGNGDYTFSFQDLVGNTGTVTGTISRIDKTAITGYVEYSTTGWTNTGVIATMTGFNKTGITVSGGASYIFTENTGYIFYYTDAYNNTGETAANVTRIDMEFPTFIGVVSGTSYATGVAVNFVDNVGATATLNGTAYNNMDPITNEGINVLVVTDLAGNSTGATFFIDTTTPIITLNGTSVITLEVFSPYIESGATRADNGTGGIANISGTVNTGALGPYILTYRYSDGFHTTTETRTITIVDTTLPVITLNGSGTITLERTTGYVELGAERSDNYDGTGTVTGINILGTVDNQTSGTYILTYQHIDNAGNTGTTTRTVNVIDTTNPTAQIIYSTTGLTYQDVLATITGFSEAIISLNETGFTFTGNGSFTFTFTDIYGNPGSGTATVDRIDKTPVTGTIIYDVVGRTGGNVRAEITGFNKTGVTITSADSYVFTGNGSYIFTYIDSYGNTGFDTAVVTGIDKTAPLITNTGLSTVSTGGVTFNSIQVTETGAGINIISLNYSGIVNATGAGSIGLSTGDLANISGVIAGLNDNQTYIYIITATDLVGNTTTITGGTFTTLFDYQEQYTNIATALQSTSISGNLDQITNDNVGSFSGLYFEQSAGKIEFLAPVNLTDTGTIAFLQNLDDYLYMSGGFINFIISSGSTTSGKALQNTPAKLTMYLNPALLPDGSPDESLIVVKDNNGNIIMPSSSVINNLTCAGTSPQVCTFIADHFTSFGVKPILSGVSIQSNNASGVRALSGNIITLSFTGSEDLTGVSATIFGNSASVVGAGAVWTATYTTNGSEAEGFINFTITFEDLFGNAGDVYTGASNIVFDTTLPIITINNPDTAPAQSKTITATGTDTYLSGFFLSITGSNICDGTLTFQAYTSLTFTGESDNGKYVCYETIDIAGNIAYASSAMITGIDTMKPNASINYNPASGARTNTDVLATLTGYSETLTGINQTTENFTNSGTFIFTFSDLAGNTGEATATVNRIDKTQPTFAGVVSGSAYNTNQAIIFDDTNLSGATLNGAAYNSGDNISSEGVYIFIVSDLAGNSTGATFIIDKTQPTFAGVVSGSAYNTNQAIIFDDTNLSGAVLDGNPYTSGSTITGEGIHAFIVSDLAGNSTGATFIIDKTQPTFAGVSSGAYYNVNKSITFDDTNLSGAVLDGNPYTSGSTITGEGIHAFIVNDLAGNSTGATFIIDKTQPTFGGVTSGAYYSGTVTITFDDTNLSGATLNGTSISSGYSTGVDGTFILIVRDRAGNSTGATFFIDNTLPTVGTGFISAGNTGVNGSTGYYNGTITIRADVSDGGAGINTGSCEYTINGTRNAATYTTGYCFASGLSPAANISIRFRVKDTVGNLNTGGIKNYIYDVTPPTVSDNATGTRTGANVTVILTAADTGVGMSGTRYCVDTGGTCTPTLSGISVSVTGAAGVVTHKFVRYYSIDKLNNTGVIQTSVQIHIDKETPILTGTTTYSSNNGTNSGYAASGDTITINFTSHEALSSLPTITYSGGSSSAGTVTSLGGNSYSATYAMKGSDTQGYIRFNVAMVDSVGNTGMVNITGAIIYDNIAPIGIGFTNPTGTSYRQSQTGSAYRDITRSTGSEINFGPNSLQIEYSINMFGGVDTIITTGTNNDGSYHWTVNSADTSSAQMRIIATDLAGNTATFTSSGFKIDSTAPTGPTFIYPTGSEYLKGGSGYTITRTGGNDANLSGKILQRSTDGGSNFTTLATLADGDFSYVRTASVLNSSTIRFGIYYQDKGGLTSPYIQTTNFTIDSIKPTLIFGDTSTARRNTNATGTATATDITGGIWTMGTQHRTDVQFDATCGGGTGTVPVLTSDGTGYVYACVQDRAGNTTTGVQMYRIDKTAPIVTMPADKITNTGTLIDITTDANVAGISGYTRSKVSGPGTITFSTGTTVQDPTVTGSVDGDYVLQVVVKDNANNITTGTMNFTRHTTAPILTGSTGVLNTTSQTPNYSFTGNEIGTISYTGGCTSAITGAISGFNTITFNTLSNATYTGCQLKVTDSVGNASSRLTIPTFTVSYTAPSGGGGGGGGGGGIDICTSSQLMCVNNVYVAKTGVACAGGNLNKACGSTGAVATTGTAIVTSTGTELERAIAMMFDNGMTKYNTKVGFQPQNYITREQAAKFFVMFAKNVMSKAPNTGKIAVFKDLKIADPSLTTSIIQSFQLSIFNGYPDGYFRVRSNMTRGEGLAVAMRIYLGKKLSETNIAPWYKNYFTQAKALGIINSTEDIKTFGDKMTREKMGVILYRIYKLKK